MSMPDLPPGEAVADARPPTAPPEAHRGKRFHWLVCDRASEPSIGEWLRREGVWAEGSTDKRITPLEMNRRGWTYWGPVKVPKELRK